MKNPPLPVSDEALYALAPRTIKSYRQLRYEGGGMGVALAQFAPDDQALITRVYSNLGELLAILRAGHDDPEATFPKVADFCARSGWNDLVQRMRGLKTGDHDAPALQRQVLHDLKGGALQALAVYLRLVEMKVSQPQALQRMFFLTRDQLKIMRNAIDGLDPAGAAADRTTRLHHVTLLMEKWSGSDYRLGDEKARIRATSRYEGAIAERCLEFSALDRVLYNLLNNATRHTADGLVDLVILPLDDGDTNLRFVVINRLTAEQRASLEARFPSDLGQVFLGGFTTSGNGHGLGLRICADFVCNAYGLPNVDQGLNEGHFGAAFLDERFAAWVHWPIAD